MLKVVRRWRPNKNLRLAQIRCFLLAAPYCTYSGSFNVDHSAALPERRSKPREPQHHKEKPMWPKVDYVTTTAYWTTVASTLITRRQFPKERRKPRKNTKPEGKAT